MTNTMLKNSSLDLILHQTAYFVIPPSPLILCKLLDMIIMNNLKIDREII